MVDVSRPKPSANDALLLHYQLVMVRAPKIQHNNLAIAEDVSIAERSKARDNL
jgi:hypothetical protein